MASNEILTADQRAFRREISAYSLHLDLIRGLAALLVLVGHLRLTITGHTGAVVGKHNPNSIFLSHPANATGLGHASVVVFFVLSGYLVGGSILRDINRNAFSWSKYAIRRISRLWTVLVPALLLGGGIDHLTNLLFAGTSIFVSNPFTASLRLPNAFDFVNYLFFLQFIDRLSILSFGTNVALWSLSAEFWYYMLFPTLAAALFSASLSEYSRVSLLILAALLMWFIGSGICQYFPLWPCGVGAYLVPARIPSGIQKIAITALLLQFCFVLYFVRSHAINTLAPDMASPSHLRFYSMGCSIGLPRLRAPSTRVSPMEYRFHPLRYTRIIFHCASSLRSVWRTGHREYFIAQRL